MADSPRGYWRLGETSGTTAANETGGQTGQYQNGVTLNVTGALTGDTNKAVRFDGTNDQISMGDPSTGSLDFGTGNFTFEAWVKGTAAEDRTIAGKASSSSTSRLWNVGITDDAGHVGEVRAAVYDGTNLRVGYGPAGVRVDNNAWHYVAVVFDRVGGITVYVDGSSRFTAGGFTNSISNDGAFMLGESQNPNVPNGFRGDLDEAAVYVSALSATRIAAHRARGLGN